LRRRCVLQRFAAICNVLSRNSLSDRVSDIGHPRVTEVFAEKAPKTIYVEVGSDGQVRKVRVVKHR
jgi:hypothetical protein